MVSVWSTPSRFTATWAVVQVAVALGALGTPHMRAPGPAWVVAAGYALVALTVLWAGRRILRGAPPPASLASAQRAARRAPPAVLIMGSAVTLAVWTGLWRAEHSAIVSNMIGFGSTGAIVLALYGLLAWGGAPDPNARRAAMLVTAVALLLAVALPVLAVADFPELDYTDEPWFLDVGWAFAQTGHLSSPMHLGEYGVFVGILAYNYFVGLGAWLFGPEIAPVRLLHLIWVVTLLLAVYDVTRRLYGRPAALIAAAFTAASAIVFEFGLFVRPDVPMTALVAAGLWLHVVADERSSTLLHFLSGAVIGLSFQAHPNGLVFCLVFALAYSLDLITALLRHRRPMIQPRWLAFAAGGLLGGAGVFLLAQYFPYYRPHLANFQAVMPLQGHFLPFLTGNVATMLHIEWQRLAAYGLRGPLEVPLALIAALAAWQRRTDADRRLLRLLALAGVGFLLMVSSPAVFYGVNFVPVIAPLVGALLWHGVDRLRERTRGTWSTAIAVGIALAATLGPGLGRLTTALEEGYNRHFFACAAESAATLAEAGGLSEGALVYLYEPVMWLAHPQAERYVARLLTEVIWPATRGLSWEQALEEAAPDALLLGPYGARPPEEAYIRRHNFVRMDVESDGTPCWSIWLRPERAADS